MNKQSKPTCPMCHGKQTSLRVSCRDHFTTGEVFDVYECSDCSLIWTLNPPTPDCMGAYYDTDAYISHSNTKQGIVNKVYHLVRSFMLYKKALLIEKHTPTKPGSLLDIGAGIGLFCNYMRKRGWQIEGIEPSVKARSYAQECYNLKLKDVSHLSKLPKESKDIVTLWHVLEHIPNMNEELSLIHSIIKPGGKLVLALPNPASFDASVYKEFWAAYDVPRHLWHFKALALTRLLEKYNFRLIDLKTMPFDGFYISILSEQHKKNSFAFLKGGWTGLKGWLKSQRRKEKSSSLIYIFEKK